MGRSAGGSRLRREDRRVVRTLAVTCGISVAGIYYVPPLIASIASDLDVSGAATGALVAAPQLGYVAGLLLLVPLGDVVERRTLATGMLLAALLGALGCAVAPTAGTLLAALVVVGVAASATQILQAGAATVGGDAARGRVLAVVMGGVFSGILLARLLSGLVSTLAGWRAVFAAAAVVIVVGVGVLRAGLPTTRAASDASYVELLRSIGGLVRRETELRRRMVLGALHMFGFSVLWTALTLLLADEPYGYSDAAIGLFALAGVGGITAGRVAGAQRDRDRGDRANSAFLVCVLGAWLVLLLGERSVVLLALGVLALDIGVQGTQVVNQSAVFALRAGAASRLTTAYTASIFSGAAVGSVCSAVAYAHGGWPAVCALGATAATLGLAIWSRSAAPGQRPGRLRR